MFGVWRNCGGKLNGIGNAFGGRGRYVDAVAVKVIVECANVPAINAVTGPGVADGQGIVDKYSSAGWCKGRAIEIVSAVELGFGRKARVDEGWP